MAVLYSFKERRFCCWFPRISGFNFWITLFFISYYVNCFRPDISVVFSWLYWNINMFEFKVSSVIWWRCVLLNDYHSKVSWHLLHLINYHCMYMCEIRTFKIYSLSNFHVSNTVLLIIITMLYVESPELTNVITGSLYPLTKHLPICLTPQLLRTTILLSVSMSL